MSDDASREHAASDKRRGQFAEKGQIARSKELLSAFVLGAGVLTLMNLGPSMGKLLLNTTARMLGELDHPINEELLILVGACFLQIVLPTSILAACGAIVSALIQHKGVIPFRPPSFDLTRIDIPGKLASLFNLKESGQNILVNMMKVVVLGTVLYAAARDPLLTFISSVPSSIGLGLQDAGMIFKMILVRGLSVMVLFGAADFLLNWWRIEQRMKMSTQEVRDEAKDANGDSSVKGRRKKLARELIQKRSLKNVPKADVIVVNPTHYAVALLYDNNKMAAPIVVAKGVDVLAERIRALGRKHAVPIVSQPPLARMLYAQVKVGRAVPGDLYQAVAVVLAHCYRLKKRVS